MKVSVSLDMEIGKFLDSKVGEMERKRELEKIVQKP